MISRTSSPERFRRGIAAIVAGGAAGLALWFAGLPAPAAWIAGGIVALGVLWCLLLLLRLRLRAAVADVELAAANARLAAVRDERESLASDLTQLGKYGNLMLESADLAETLQISQQFLLRLLPGCAGSFYPLIDGEGLSEATHLWGTHVAETRAQATWNDCRALGAWLRHRRRLRRPFPVVEAPSVHEATDTHPHEHGPECGHRGVEHGDHVDYVHDGHRHAPHGEHYDEH